MIASPHAASRTGADPARNDGAGPEGAGPIGQPDGRPINGNRVGQAAASAVDSLIDSRHESSGGNRNTCRAASAGPDAGQHPSGGLTVQELAAQPSAPTLSPPVWAGPLRLAGTGAFSLTNPGNRVGSVSGTAGELSLSNARTLAIGGSGLSFFGFGDLIRSGDERMSSLMIAGVEGSDFFFRFIPLRTKPRVVVVS